MLPAALLGCYERRLPRPPLWVGIAFAALAAALVVSDLLLGLHQQAVGPLLMGAVVLATTIASRRQGPAVTEITAEGLRVELPYRRPQVVAWEQVLGIRVLTRRNAPQALLPGGGQVQLLGLPDAVARELAARLSAVLGRPVRFEVDDQLVSP